MGQAYENRAPSPRFTVFTPTYNRGDVLHRVFESLKKQTFRDFEWLVVDDGSTDDTADRMKAWALQADFPVRYVWQKNQHKKTAFNHGVREARGELFLPLDSDDEIFPQTLAVFDRVWRSIPEDQRAGFAGATGLCVYENGDVVGDVFPQDPLDCTALELRYAHRVRGEKFGFATTSLLKQFPYPESVKGFVPESCVWFAIARAGYKLRLVNTPVRTYHQTDGSLAHEQFFTMSHPDGFALMARDTLENIRWFRHDPKEFLVTAVNYSRFHFHLARQSPGKKWPVKNRIARMLAVAAVPLGYLLHVRDRYRYSRASR